MYTLSNEADGDYRRSNNSFDWPWRGIQGMAGPHIAQALVFNGETAIKKPDLGRLRSQIQTSCSRTMWATRSDQGTISLHPLLYLFSTTSANISWYDVVLAELLQTHSHAYYREQCSAVVVIIWARACFMPQQEVVWCVQVQVGNHISRLQKCAHTVLMVWGQHVFCQLYCHGLRLLQET